MKFRMILFAALALPLAACVGSPAVRQAKAEKAGAMIEAAQIRFDQARPSAELVLPYLSPERAQRVSLALALTERALLAARQAATAAELRAALKKAEAETTTIVTQIDIQSVPTSPPS